MPRSRRAALGLLSSTAIACGLLLAGCKPQPKASFKALDITGADYARDFSLPDTDGKVRTIADFKGRVTVVFFGYTQCPDVCPTTMLTLAEVKKQMGADGDKVQVVFITLDPERDSAAILKEYVKHFDPTVVALRGTLEQTQATAAAFKVYFAKSPGATPDSYTIDHTAASFVFDPQGRIRLYLRHTSTPQEIAGDLKQLLA